VWYILLVLRIKYVKFSSQHFPAHQDQGCQMLD